MGKIVKGMDSLGCVFINRSEQLDYIIWRRTMMMSSVRMTIADMGCSVARRVVVLQDRHIPCRARLSFFCVDNNLTLTRMSCTYE